MKTCIQCGTSTEEKFCPNCGQKQDVSRLTVKSFFSDFFSRIYGLDGAFPRTAIGLFKNPGTVALDYIKGIRGKYVGPVGYYFLMFAILLLLIKVSGFSVSDYFPKTEDLSNSIIDETRTTRSQEAKVMAKMVQEKIHDNLQYIAVLMVPFVGFWTRLWFRKSGFNLLESIVLAFFSHGQAQIFNIIGFLVFAVSGYKNSIVIGLVATIYQMIAISLFFTQKISIKSILKSFFAYALAYASFLLFTTISITILLILKRSLS
ncbi:DUF3667 domain-containing protein [Reichenbachiella sp.]|uniref:DUF3667 domain-containing protein n=1 Tax=Reichenbachiella sp. TaxID=2184521 RepID=UPI003BAFCAE9